MISKNKRGLIILLLLSIVLIGSVVKNEFAKDGALIQKDDGTEQLVYETKLVALDKTETSLENHKNKVIVLNFWTTWCNYCKNEIPELNKFYNKQSGNVEFLAINMTADEKNIKSTEKFRKQYDVKFPIFLDESGFLQKSFKILAFPTTLIIDSSGIVRHRIQGEVTQEQLNQMISKL
ncbi:TlpA disulfide reductase family protein [Lysinibacillus sp. FSL H8-0500]|uniref:TlpA family protein disulfide reductase n=1 Tax=Lysinibacillus sp. FSL H8-0500 TaxID=2921393 RepID=UPI0031015CCD